MVQNLSSSEKLSAGWISILALFGSELESSAGSRATDITLDGPEPVLPGAAKMTFIVPKGFLGVLNLLGLADHWNDAKTASIFLLRPTDSNDFANFYSHLWCVPSLGGTGNKGSDCASWDFLPSYLAI